METFALHVWPSTTADCSTAESKWTSTSLTRPRVEIFEMGRPSILPSGMKLVGDVAGEEDLVVFGTVEGEVHVDGAICAGHLGESVVLPLGAVDVFEPVNRVFFSQ